MELSKQQKRAVESDSQYIAILAGAGSGKTRTLTERICNLVEYRNVKPNEILALTFTAKAANEMKKRVIAGIGEKGQPIVIKTFHSFGLQLLRTYSGLAGFSDTFEIADSNMRNYIAQKISNQYKLNIEPKALLKSFSDIKNGLCECDDDNKAMFDEYNLALRTNNCIDIDDMIWLTVKVIKEHPEVYDNVRSMFKHILIDEFQDTNEIQSEFVILLLNNNTSLCIVGDDDQCIYEWRGSKPDIIRDFAKRNDVEAIYLDNNYRSQKNIVEIANRFIKNNLNRLFKKMFAKVESTDKPHYYKASSQENEAILIAKIIQSLHNNENYKYSQIAILLRSANQADPICDALKDNSVPCLHKNEKRGTEIIDFTKVLDAILEYRDNSLSKAINFPSAVLDNFTYMDILDDFDLNGLSVKEAFEYIYNHNEIDWEYAKYFRERFEVISSLHKLVISDSSVNLFDVLDRLYELYKKEAEELIIADKSKLSCVKGCIDLYQEWQKTNENTGIMSFIDYIICAVENDDEILNFEDVDSVNIMTCHRSKGLEFSVVIIPGVQVGVFPNDYFIHSQEDLEQERRLFYVAMTRAVDRLYITSYENPFYNNNSDYIERGFVSEIPELIKKDAPKSWSCSGDDTSVSSIRDDVNYGENSNEYEDDMTYGGYTEDDFGCYEEYLEYLEWRDLL